MKIDRCLILLFYKGTELNVMSDENTEILFYNQQVQINHMCDTCHTISPCNDNA